MSPLDAVVSGCCRVGGRCFKQNYVMVVIPFMNGGLTADIDGSLTAGIDIDRQGTALAGVTPGVESSRSRELRLTTTSSRASGNEGDSMIPVTR